MLRVVNNSTITRILFSIFNVGILVTAYAQDKDVLPPVSSTYAITNVTVEQAPGRVIDKASVVIRNGLIQDVGKNIFIPPDAILVSGDSLFVYAGFIDGYSHAGVKKPENTNMERPKDPGNPLPEQAGITPERDVRDYLDPDERTLVDIRSAGFTCSHVVPYGVFLPGNGAIILLNGDTGDEMVLRPNSSFYSKLVARPGVYPSTTMGVMAKWRELYHQAGLAKSYEKLYAANSNGLPRHCPDRILESFYPVIDNKQPVLFKAERVLDIQRVLTLQRDLGLSSIMIGNVKEGWDVIDKLKSSHAKVFLSLNLPEEPKDDTDSLTDKETIALQKRREEFIRKYVGQAATFQQAGMKFGFCTMGIMGKHIHKNLCRIVAAGLSPDDALAALTTYPAEMLGLSDRLGTIDKGKIANLVVSNRPYFEEKAEIKFVFIDGELVTCKKLLADNSNARKIRIDGVWSLTTETPQGKVDLKVNFKKDEDRYKGWITGGNLPENTRLTNIAIEGNKLRFVYSVKVGENVVDVTVEGTIQEKNFNGNMVVGKYGTYPIGGTKDPEI